MADDRDMQPADVTPGHGTEYGLVAAIQTGSMERGLEVAERLRTGIVHVNDQTVGHRTAAGPRLPVLTGGYQSRPVASLIAWSRMARPSASSSSVAVSGGAIRKTPPMPGS